MADTNTKVTPIEIDDLYEVTTLTYTACTETGDDDTEDMWFTVPAGRRGTQRIIVIVTVADSHGAVDIKIEAGDLWCASAKEVSVAQNTTKVFMLETARHIDKDEEIHMVFTPAAGKALDTDHACEVAVVFTY
jgi:hypothetical protein